MLRNPLRREMDRRGLTTEETAEILGVGTSTVYSWLNGERFPRNANFKSIAEFVDMDEVVMLEEWQTWQKNRVKAKKEWKAWAEEHPPLKEEDI